MVRLIVGGCLAALSAIILLANARLMVVSLRGKQNVSFIPIVGAACGIAAILILPRVAWWWIGVPLALDIGTLALVFWAVERLVDALRGVDRRHEPPP